MLDLPLPLRTLQHMDCHWAWDTRDVATPQLYFHAGSKTGIGCFLFTASVHRLGKSIKLSRRGVRTPGPDDTLECIKCVELHLGAELDARAARTPTGSRAAPRAYTKPGRGKQSVNAK